MLLIPPVWAQGPDTVFQFKNATSARALQEIATTLRTVANIRRVTVDAPAASLAVSGTPDELAAAAWLVAQLDKPARVALSLLQNQSAVFGGDHYVVYYLKNLSVPVGLQEAITTLRTVEDIQKI